MYRLAASLLAASLAAAAARSDVRRDEWTVGRRVETTSGPVEGHAAPNATDVSEYLGIPYAKPPIDGLRFQPPVRYEGSSTINGTNFVSPRF